MAKLGGKNKPDITWTFENKLYIAKFYHKDGYTSLAYAFDVEPYDVYNLYYRLKRAGKAERYARYWDKLYGRGVPW
jgi:hypothetical protein